MLGMSLQLQDCEVCGIEVVCGITKEEIVETLLEVLEELGVRFRFFRNLFETDKGSIIIEDCGKSRLGIQLYRIVFPDEIIMRKFRERLMSKRAGG